MTKWKPSWKRGKGKAHVRKPKVSKAVKTFVKSQVEKSTLGYIMNVNATSTNYPYFGGPGSCTVLLNNLSPTVAPADSAVNMGSIGGTGYNVFMQNNPGPRQGDIIKNRYIHIRGILSPDSNASPVDDIIRILLFVDKQCKAGQPNVNQVLDQTDCVESSYNNTNIDFKKRFTILYDKTHRLTSIATPLYTNGVLDTTGNTLFPPMKFIEIKKKLNFTTDYSRASGGTFADMDTGALCLGFVTVGHPLSGSSQWQLRFTYNFEYETHNERKEKI